MAEAVAEPCGLRRAFAFLIIFFVVLTSETTRFYQITILRCASPETLLVPWRAGEYSSMKQKRYDNLQEFEGTHAAE
jgi:hypothetical protein